MKPPDAKAETAIRETGNLIRQKKVRLRKRIAGNPALQRDFDFLVSKTRWAEEALLARLFWDCNMMSADAKRVLALEKKKNWPIGEVKLRRTIKSIFKTAEQIERVNQTEFSPARTAFFSD